MAVKKIVKFAAVSVMKIFYGDKIAGIKYPVVTVGAFDGVHRGHAMLLSVLRERASGLGGESVVVTFDPHPGLVLGKAGVNARFLTSKEEKLVLFADAGIDNTVVLRFDDALSRMSACDFVEKILIGNIGMKHLIVGFNHRLGKGGRGGYSEIAGCALKQSFGLEQLPGLPGEEGIISSTVIREALEKGDLASANRMLGYSYFLRGTIVEGRQLGRSIGFPTANVSPDYPYKLLPGDGVYVVRISFNGGWYGGMANIGHRPTVNRKGGPRSVEVHIFDFDKYIYGRDVTLTFHARLRDEMKFPTVEALRDQLIRDKAAAIGCLEGI